MSQMRFQPRKSTHMQLTHIDVLISHRFVVYFLLLFIFPLFTCLYNTRIPSSFANTATINSKFYRTNAHAGLCITSYWIKPKHFHLPEHAQSISFAHTSTECSMIVRSDNRDGDPIAPLASITCSLCSASGRARQLASLLCDIQTSNELRVLHDKDADNDHEYDYEDYDNDSNASSDVTLTENAGRISGQIKQLTTKRIVIEIFKTSRHRGV